MTRVEGPGGVVEDAPVATDPVDLPPEAAHGRVFLSYKREDVEAVELARALETRGVEVWIDRTGIPPGADWVERVGVAITNARAVVAVVSRPFLASVNCRRELEEAERAGKRVVPVLLDAQMEPDDLPLGLRTANWIPWIAGVDAVAAQVETAVSTDVAWLDEHARLHTTGMRLVAGEGWSVALRGSDLRRATALLEEHGDRDTPPFVTDEQRSLLQASRLRRRVWAAGLVAAVLVLALLAANLVQAADARRSSESERLAATADSLVDTQLDLAVRLALHAGDVAGTDAAFVSLVGTLTAGPGLREVTPLATAVDRAALGAVDGTAVVVDDAGRPSLLTGDGRVVAVDRLTAVTAVATDGRTALLGTAAGQVARIDRDGARRAEDCAVGGRVEAVAHGGDRALVAVDPDGQGGGVDLVALDPTCRQTVVWRTDDAVVALVAGTDGASWAAVTREDLLALGREGEPTPVVEVPLADPVAGAVSAIAVTSDAVLVGRVSGRVEHRAVAAPDEPTWSRPVHGDVVTALAVDGDRAVSTDLDGALVAWDLDGDVLVDGLSHAGRDAEVSSPVAVAVAGDVVETITRQGQRQRWSTVHDSPLVERLADVAAVGLVVREGGQVVVAVHPGDLGWPSDGPTATALAGSADGLLVAGFDDGSVAALASSWTAVGRLGAQVTHVAAAADGGTVAAADGRDLLIAGADGPVVVEGVGPVRSLAVTGAGDVLGGVDGEVRRWSVGGEERQPVMSEHSGTVDALTVLAGSGRIVSGGDDRSIRIWDDVTYEQLTRLVGHTERVLDVAASDDGGRLTSVDEAGELHHWDLEQGAALLRPMRHPTDGLVRFVALLGPTDPVTAGPGAFRWRLSPSDVRSAGCGLARSRALTDAEAAQLLRGLQPRDPCGGEGPAGS